MIFSIKNKHYPNGFEKFRWVVHILPRSVEPPKICATCQGRRMVSSGPFDLDEPRTCETCNGTGHLSVVNTAMAPTASVELEEAMQKLLDEHLEKP